MTMPRQSGLTWRGLIGSLMLAALASAIGPLPVLAEERHGLSIFGDLKYPADFKHFDYVNPDAPKGGRLRTMGTGSVLTFDSFNDFITRGDAAQGIELIYDSLMTRANDEPDAVYGLVARSAEVAPDGLSVTFRLRPEAKFADSSPVTSADVIFTLDALKTKGKYQWQAALRDVVEAKAADPLTVTYRFQGQLIRDLPVLVATLPILSKAWHDTHDFGEPSLDPPLGSGPYKIGKFRQGDFVSYVRRGDYWAKDLPVNVGRSNFDEVVIHYFAERSIGFEALKAGDLDLREEFSSKDWATAYNIEQIRTGKMIKEELPDETPTGAQGFFLNMRREKFKDPRVRQALAYAFDFEWSKKNLFYGQYQRTESYFENSDMKASGPPGADELELLEPFRDKVPPEVFGEPVSPPKSDGSGQDRKNVRQAKKLLTEAGWTIKDGKARSAAGEPFQIEFLLDDPAFARIIGPFVQNLKQLGIDASVRNVDSSQFQRRLESFDFDVLVQRYGVGLTPGVNLRAFWGSAAAKEPGSLNIGGISDPVVDALIEKVVAARSRPALLAATRALDRVLRAHHFWVPQWYNRTHRLGYWNRFSRPATKPRYDRGVIDTWWYDAAKDAKLQAQ